MMTPTTEQLDQLKQEDLLELLKQLLPLVAEVERLRSVSKNWKLKTSD